MHRNAMELRRAERSGKHFLNPVPTPVGGFGIMLKVLPKRFTNRAQMLPDHPLGPFVTDSEVLKTTSSSGLRVTWFGHSSLLIEIDGVRLLTDPVWETMASPVSFAGPKRFYPPTLGLEDLPKIDAVLISHDHYDHLGAETIGRLSRLKSLVETRWIAPLGVAELLHEMGVRPGAVTELDWTEQATIAGGEPGSACVVTALPARHFSGRSLLNRFQTLWASFALTTSRHRVYFGADSGWWPGFAEIAEQYGPFDLTMLEIGAYDELWKNIHMGPDGAARAFADMGRQGLLMPIHWGLFNLAFHAWDQPIERLIELANQTGIDLWLPEPGRPSEVRSDSPERVFWWRKPFGESLEESSMGDVAFKTRR